MHLLIDGYLRAARDRSISRLRYFLRRADLKTAISQLGEKVLLDYRSNSKHIGAHGLDLDSGQLTGGQVHRRF